MSHAYEFEAPLHYIKHIKGMLSNRHGVAAVTRGFWKMLLSWWHCTAPPLGSIVDEKAYWSGQLYCWSWKRSVLKSYLAFIPKKKNYIHVFYFIFGI